MGHHATAAILRVEAARVRMIEWYSMFKWGGRTQVPSDHSPMVNFGQIKSCRESLPAITGSS